MPRHKKLRYIEVGVDDMRRLLGSSYHLVSIDTDAAVAFLELEIDEGFVALGINRGVAEQLVEVLTMFLAEKPD